MTQDITPPTQGEPAPAALELTPVAETPVQEPVSGSWIGNLLSHPKAPLVAGALFLLVAGAIAASRMNVSLPVLGSPDIVVFDPVRFQNAQRAAASILAANPSADISLTLTQVAKHAEAVIKEESGGAVVLVKQAVVAPDGIPDITDAVLERFGLPTSVPTVRVSLGEDLQSVAPTDSAFSDGKLREDYRLELQQRTLAIQADAQKKSQQEQAIP